MEHKKLTITVLVILLVAAAAGVFASVPEARSTPGHVDQALAQAVPDWQQVNNSSFGDPQTGEVSALEAFNGHLYAGTHNATAGARIFRSPDGVTWTPVTQPGFGDPHDIAPPAILDLALFNGQLFASTGRGNAGQIWNTLNGLIWAPVTVTGFSDPDNVDITAMAEFGGKIYAGISNQVSGAQIWSSFTGANNNWTRVAPTVPMTDTASVSGMAVFNDGSGDGLYAAIAFETDAPAQIWRSYGGAWETVVSDGFGDSKTTSTGGMAVFGSYLYAGTGNTASGAQLWRSNDGTNWAQAITPAFGDSNNEKVEMVYVFQNQLYVSVKNTLTGIEIWRSTDGTVWERANLDGFGDSKNTTTNGNNATADFLGQLYVGTSNVIDGGELWRMQQPYSVDLSPDQAKPGSAGQTVTYSLLISNSGNMTDTFDLTATGHTWSSSLSTALVSLAPSASETFTVTVTIPPSTADQESDTVTITATSQGDNRKTDSALLTTTAVSTPIYGVVLSPDDSLSGPSGGQAIYNLTVTNSGSVMDSFDLLPSGNSWTSTLSPQVVTLGAGDSQPLTVTVLIPPAAPALASDQVSIRATSRHDDSKNDTTILTTVSTGHSTRNYLPIVISDTAQ